jgi:hypothetical protein
VKHVNEPPVVGKGLRFETELPLKWSIGDQFDQRAAFHDPRERGPNAGGLLNSQTMQTKKVMMVLHLVFREPTEVLYATTTPVCPPPTSHPPKSNCVRRSNGFKTWLSSTFTLHRFVSWQARLYGRSGGVSSQSRGRSNGLWFQTATLSGRMYTEPRS